MNNDFTFLLVHGSWHDGSCWSVVAEHLREAGARVEAPTLAGHAVDCERSNVTHDDYVSSVIEVLDRLNEPTVLVGHSFAGSVISRVAAQASPRLCAARVLQRFRAPRW